MNTFNYKNSPFVIGLESNLEEVMSIITANKRGAVVVVDNKSILQGVVSDGDIRRALLRRATLNTPVSKIINMNVVSIKDQDGVQEIARNIFSNMTVINLIPVVNAENRLIDVIVRETS